MEFFILFVTLVALLSSVNGAKKCYPSADFIPMQENINFDALAGAWEQRYYLNSWYGGTYCMNMNITTNDYNLQMTDMVYSFYMGEPYDNQMPYKFSARESHHSTKKAFFITEMASVKSSLSEQPVKKEYIGDHIATDYETFIAIVYCDKMSSRYIGDVFIKTGLPELTNKEFRQIQRMLRGRKMGRLSESRKEWCPGK